MKTLTLKNKYQTNATLLPNDFIDNYMVDANGEFVKVYLFLLRHLDDPCSSLTLTTIADCLNNTENDILRAFRYWEKTGLLHLDRDTDGKITCIELEGTSPARRGGAGSGIRANSGAGAQAGGIAHSDIGAQSGSIERSDIGAQSGSIVRSDIGAQPGAGMSTAAAAGSKAVALDTFRAQKEIKSLLFIAEQYLGKTLTHTDVETITYFYETLHMSADLIEYLIESCVENGHKSMHYIRKVAFSWFEAGIETVARAKEESALYSRNCYTVLNAFGIKNRGPASSELAYIKKWAEEYAFSSDIIEEACRRTIAATHQPSFEYADSILTKWHQKKIRSLNDITALDEAYLRERSSGRASTKTRASARNLNNFERRNYDMESLEEQLLNSN